MGNFVEIKKSKLADKVKVNHLSYLGDSTVGKNTNIGAGTITCNYDGKNKYQSKIGNNCFVGTNSSIIAPVSIGENSYIAAGSVITKNVPKNYFSISRSKQKNIKNFVLEVSSHGIDQGRIHELNFEYGIFTNLSRDHLDYHKTMNNYFLSKERFFIENVKK